jgi:hypothetical protein
MKQELEARGAKSGGATPAKDADASGGPRQSATETAVGPSDGAVLGGGMNTGSLADRIPEGESSWYI